MRFYAREKVLGPAKPMWYVKGTGFRMEPDMLYEIA